MRKIQSVLIGSSLLIAAMMSFSSHGALSNQGANSMAQIQAEFVAQQDWMIASLWSEQGVEVQVKSYSTRTMQQLRALHTAFRTNQPLSQQELDQVIIITCRKPECGK